MANRHRGSLGGVIRARLVWNKCVGSHDLCTWRLRNFAFATGGSARVAFLTLGARVLTIPG